MRRLRMSDCGLRFCVAFLVLALASPVLAYVTSKSLLSTGQIVQQKWTSSAFPIQWRMNPTIGPNVTGDRQQADVFRQSFAAWQAITTANISFSEGPTTSAALKPGFDQINLITTNVTTADYPSSAIGLTLTFTFDTTGVDQFGRQVDFPGQIVEADIMFNPATQLSTNSTVPSDRIDLESVATHEIGHLLGLDHAALLSSTMYPNIQSGVSYPRTLSVDDIAGVSTIYPNASFASKVTLSGTVRTTSNTAVYGAIVVALDANGRALASSITDPTGRYTIAGIDPGTYTIYAEPLDQPTTLTNFQTLPRIYPGATAFTNFTTRFR